MSEMRGQYRARSHVPAGGAKYGNRKVQINGIWFDSQAEALRCQELLTLATERKIRDLQLQPRFELAPAVTLSGRRKPSLRYKADFSYYELGDDGEWRYVVEDVKSPATKTTAYKMRRHLMMSVHGIEVREVTG